MGPFRSLEEAVLFRELIGLFGGNCDGIEIVVEEVTKLRKPYGVETAEKRGLLILAEKGDISESPRELRVRISAEGSESGNGKSDHGGNPHGKGQ